MKIITNNVPRLTLDAFELTPKEREEFDYLDWAGGDVDATFFRYKGQLYDLNEFMRQEGGDFKAWDGAAPDSYFSGILIKLIDESVIVGRYFS